MWLACHERLLTNMERRRHHMTSDSSCTVCGAVSETVDHVLRQCPLAKAVWTSVVKPDRILEFLSLDLQSWFAANLSQPDYFGCVESDWDILFATLVWSIWLRRNKLIFESAPVVCEPVLLIGNRMVEEFRTAVTTGRLPVRSGNAIHRAGVRWEAPPPPWCKVNVDDACDSATGRASCGGAIRSDSGQWLMGFSRQLGLCSSLEAELWGIFEGLMCAWSIRIANLILESDCKEALQMIDRVRHSNRRSSLVEHILRLLNRDWVVRLEFVPREGNVVADYMAKRDCGDDFICHRLMGGVKEYWMHLHVGGKFVRDPYVRYEGGTLVEVKDVTEDANVEVEGASEDAGVGVEGAGAGVEGATEGANVEVEGVGAGAEGVIEGANVEVEGATEGASVGVEGAAAGVEGVSEGANVEVEGATEGASVGVEGVGAGVIRVKGATEGASVGVKGAGAGVEGATEGANVGVEGATEGASVEVEGTGAGVEGATEGVTVEVKGAGAGVEGAPEGAGVGVEGAGEVECDNESKNAYSINTELLSDNEGDEELQAARVMRKCKQHRGGTEVESDNENSREENDIEAEIHIETDNEGGDAEIEENTNENDSDDYNIDENESSLASSDEEEDEATLRRKKIPKYNRNSESPQFCLGMLFTDGKEFKDAIYKYSRCSRRELKIVKNEPKRISVKCIASAKCPWRIYASTNRQTRCIQVKTFINEHNYPVSFKNKMVSMKVIAEHFEDTIKDHPKMKIREIQRRIQSELHVNVPNARCRRAKSLVTSRLAGSCKEEFALLWDYADELRTKNPGSWKEECRPIMGLDGCFLKGPFKGVLLGAVGRDGNDQMYPIAWAVAEGESTDSWSWFLSLVSIDLGMEDGFGYTIISDQHKGLEVAINDILPRVEHRNCARHVYANWSGRKREKTFQFAFWQIVKSTTEREWEDNKQVLSKLDEKVAAELFGKQEKKWTKAFQGLHATSDIVDNNMCEAFNSSIIEARYKSIITMLEEIIVKIMTRIVEKRHFINTWKYNYGPLIKKKFDVIKKDSVAWRMVWNGEGGCEVKKGRKQYHVNLNEKTCSCRKWQLCGLPCQHACCAIWHTGGDPDDYLHSCYLKDTYIKAYSYALQPINGSHDWKKSRIEAVLPPIEREMPGRPKKNRRKAKDEQKKNEGTNKGLHTTLNSMEHNFHSGVTTRQSARTNVGLKRNVNSSSSSVTPKKKRKTTSESVREPVGTQESVASKK
ncbi:hypothetical protein GQ457_14G024710 [Hibiscus cannabinus]